VSSATNRGGVWRDVEIVGVGDVLRGLFGRVLVRGDVDPHCSGLGARNADGGAIVIEVRASTLFVCLGRLVEDARIFKNMQRQ
jgi:hypothetical protein